MPVEVTAAELVVTTSAMASQVTVRVVHDNRADAQRWAAAALEVFHEVDRTCTRFRADSDLMRANAAGDHWTAVSRPCFDALVEAYAAYRRTQGRFDPRVLDDLVRLGYDRSMTLGAPSPRTADALLGRDPLPSWRPEFRRADLEVRVGPVAVDLGGIGKGLAVRWAAHELMDVRGGYLVEAGGDCVCRGHAGDGGPWRVGIEDPRDPSRPVAVVEVTDAAVATSSVRIRQWQVAGADVHHLIDPTTGRPGGDGLLAVSVIDADPANAEVWSKTLFLTGRRGVRASAEHHGIAAVWVEESGVIGASDAATDFVVWRDLS